MRQALTLWREREEFPGSRLVGLKYMVGSGTLCYFRLKTREPRYGVGWIRNLSLMNCSFPDCGDLKHLIRREYGNEDHLASES